MTTTTMTTPEAQALMSMAVGRLFRIMSRPYEDGDIETFEDCKAAVMEASAVLRAAGAMVSSGDGHMVNYTRDRIKGA